MTAIALWCGLFCAASAATAPKTLSVEVRVSKGDPLGSHPDGNIRHLAESRTDTAAGRQVEVTAGGEVPYLDGKKTDYRFLGTVVRVVPVAQRDGDILVAVELAHSTQVVFGLAGGKRSVPTPAYNIQTTRHTRVAKLGETFKIRVSTNAPDDQVWAEVTIRAAAATK